MKDNCNFWGIVAQDECFCFSSNLNFFIWSRWNFANLIFYYWIQKIRI